MPVYEYQCLKCSTPFELHQKISEPPKTECPKCQGELRRLISMTSFHLKGSGWYKTDYASKSSPSPEKKDSQGGCETKASSCEKPGCPKTTE